MLSVRCVQKNCAAWSLLVGMRLTILPGQKVESTMSKTGELLALHATNMSTSALNFDEKVEAHRLASVSASSRTRTTLEDFPSVNLA